MTRTTNARVAGFTFLFYIAVGVASMMIFARAAGGEGVAAKLASIAQHASAVRGTVLLVVGLPLDLAGFLSGPVTSAMWIPMALFEVVLAGWLLVKGAAPPARVRAA